MDIRTWIRTWMNQNKVKMLVGMEMQLAKYKDGDPRKAAIQSKIDKFKSNIDWTEGENGIDNV